MIAVQPLSRDQRRTSWAIALGLWVLYACVGPGDTWRLPNSVTRMALPFALVQEHSLRIDRLAPLTIDKAIVDGHAYIDKAPGQSLLATPVVAAATAGARAFGLATEPEQDGRLTGFFRWCSWLAVALTTAPFAAAGAAAVYRSALRLGCSEAAALFAALVLGLCTPNFGWGTVVFGHMIAGGCIAMALDLALVLLGGRHGARLGFALGLTLGALMGLSVLVEFASAVPMAAIAMVLAVRCLGLPRARAVPILGGAALSGLAMMAPLGVYNHLAYGSALTLGYSNVTGFDGMKTGLFGISLPRAWPLVSITIAPRRGILWLSPLLAVMPFAWAAMVRRWPSAIAAVVIAVPAFYLGLNAGYAYWDGGASTGPRHIMPALPFACLAMASLWDGAGRLVRPLLLAGAGLSGVISLISATVDMNDQSKSVWPVTHDLIPRFFAGDVHNLFQAAGLPGLWSVLPLLGIGAGLLTLAYGRALQPAAPR